jgi:hypothetical protein
VLPYLGYSGPDLKRHDRRSPVAARCSSRMHRVSIGGTGSALAPQGEGGTRQGGLIHDAPLAPVPALDALPYGGVRRAHAETPRLARSDVPVEVPELVQRSTAEALGTDWAATAGAAHSRSGIGASCPLLFSSSSHQRGLCWRGPVHRPAGGPRVRERGRDGQ